MPKPFKPDRACPIPPDAERVDVDGRPHVRLRVKGKAVVYPITKDGTKYLRPAKRWYFNLREADGTIRRVKGSTDYKATEQLALELERKVGRIKSGFSDPAEEHLRRPLADHLKDYAAVLEAKGGTAEHARKTSARISTMLTGSGFCFLRDVDAGKAAEWLNALRCPSIVAIPAGDSFRPSEAARILGTTRAAVQNAVKRHQLEATGNGKARRLPRTTVEALVERSARGTSPATINHYVRAVRAFFRWLTRSKRIGSNPLETLGFTDARTDVRHARRELTADELQRLFRAAQESNRSFRGLTGSDRFHLYLAAAGTGFRANALANLTPANFDLNTPSPTVTMATRFNKARRLKVQPLPVDVADALRKYLAGRPEKARVWGGTWHASGRMAEMLRIDLDAAGIPYAVEGPDGPEYADFHALRHTYLTMGGRSGIDLRTLQELAGHSTPELTARYSHRRLYDLAGAVDKLPGLVPSQPVNTPLRMTGTDDVGALKSAPPGALAGGISPPQTASISTSEIIGSIPADMTKGLENKGNGTDLHRLASINTDGPARIRTENQGIMSPLL